MINKLLEESQRIFDPDAIGCIFLGTPHRGSPLAFVGILISLLGYWSGSKTTLLEAIQPRSRENKDLHASFIKSYPHISEKLVNFFEVVPEYLGPFPLTLVGAVQCGTRSGDFVLTLDRL